MPLYIRDDSVNALVDELQRLTNASSKTEAVRSALANEIRRQKRNKPLMERIAAIQAKGRALGLPNPAFDMKAFSDDLSDDL